MFDLGTSGTLDKTEKLALGRTYIFQNVGIS